MSNGDVISAGCDDSGNSRVQRLDSSASMVSSFSGGAQSFNIISSTSGGGECFNDMAHLSGVGLVLAGNDDSQQMVATVNENTGSVIQTHKGTLIDASTGNSNTAALNAMGILKSGKVTIAATTGLPITNTTPSNNSIEGGLITYVE